MENSHGRYLTLILVFFIHTFICVHMHANRGFSPAWSRSRSVPKKHTCVRIKKKNSVDNDHFISSLFFLYFLNTNKDILFLELQTSLPHGKISSSPFPSLKCQNFLQSHFLQMTISYLSCFS